MVHINTYLCTVIKYVQPYISENEKKNMWHLSMTYIYICSVAVYDLVRYTQGCEIRIDPQINSPYRYVFIRILFENFKNTPYGACRADTAYRQICDVLKRIEAY
jgi:hypothetical protein